MRFFCHSSTLLGHSPRTDTEASGLGHLSWTMCRQYDMRSEYPCHYSNLGGKENRTNEMKGNCKPTTVVQLRVKHLVKTKKRVHLEMFAATRWGVIPAGHQLFPCLNLKTWLITCVYGGMSDDLQ